MKLHFFYYSMSQLDSSSSIVLLRNLLRMAISTIVYHRHLFKKKCFRPRRSTNGVKIFQLIGNDEESERMVEWLEDGVFRALDKGYLRRMTLAILSTHDRKTDTSDCEEDPAIIEKYDFDIYQNRVHESNAAVDAEATESMCSFKDEALLAIETLLSKLENVTCTLQPLPNHCQLDMLLEYVPDRTPENYNPPFFKSCRFKKNEHTLDDRQRIGKIITCIHDITIDMWKA